MINPGEPDMAEDMPSTRAHSLAPYFNILLGCGFIALALFQYFGLPVLLLRGDFWWALTLIPIVLLTPTYWSVIHEAFHGVFSPNRTLNDLFGRVLGILFGSPFSLLRFGHLTHHGSNRTELDRTEIFDAASGNRGLSAAVFYLRLTFGLYAAEVASVFLFLLPRRILERIASAALAGTDRHAKRVREQVSSQMLSRHKLREIRTDCLAIILIFGLSFAAYSELWWVLAIALLGRGALISFLDNAYHYGTRLDDPHAAYNLRLPRVGAALMLYFNLHRTHHRNPGLPWYGLPHAFNAAGDSYDGDLLATSLQQLRGPVYLNEWRPREDSNLRPPD